MISVVTIDVPSGWQEIADNSYYADVSTFEAGLKCIYPIGEAERGDEVIVWQPDEYNDEQKPMFDGYDDSEVPTEARYLIEVYADGRAHNRSFFATTLDEAAGLASEEAERLINGTEQ